MPDSTSVVEWATLAHLLGSRGNKGEVAALSESDFRDRFAELDQVSLFRDGEPRRTATIESSWWHGDRLILKFEDVDSIEAADALTGFALQVPADQRVALPEGEYYLSDLVGMSLVDADSGEPIGPVESWIQFGGPSTLVVRDLASNTELLVPFVQAICQVMPNERRILARLPSGLRELNR